MRRVPIGFLSAVFAVCLYMPIMAAQPESYDSVVMGQGDPKADVVAVQKAVDQGGAVLLKGTFNVPYGEWEKIPRL